MPTRLIVSAVAAVLVLAVAAPVAGAATFRFFTSPSKAIACVWEKSGSRESLRCDVYGATNPQPPKPSSCDLEYGPIFRMTARGKPRRICVGDAAINDTSRTIPYGSSRRYGSFKCVSRRTGMSCSNRALHGWTLSKQSQKLR